MKKILITGGSGDISQALMNELEHRFIIYTPSKDELDVSSISSVTEYFSDNKFDIVINNAGTLYSALLKDSIPELWIRDINVNLIGTYLVTRQALINNKDALIINISSTAAFNSYGDWTSYCASKAGVLKISDGIYKDGYNVITLCPGAIDTKIRNELKINNPNVMTVDEGIKPILAAINGEYNIGNIIFYRKNELRIMCNKSGT